MKKTASDITSGSGSVWACKSESASAERASAERASADRASAESASAERASAERASAERASAESASAESASAESASAESASAVCSKTPLPGLGTPALCKWSSFTNKKKNQSKINISFPVSGLRKDSDI